MTRLAHCAFALGLAAGATLAAAHGNAHGDAASAAPREQTPWGIAGDARTATRTVRITMSDAMRFAPERLQFKAGETVRFVVANEGRAMHEMVLGRRAELDAHAALMAKYPGMEHDAPYMAHVAPGRSGEIVWTFNRAGRFEFACLVAGHYQAGMRGRIVVRP